MIKFLLVAILGFFILRWLLKKAVLMIFWTYGQQLRKEMEQRETERYDFEKDGLRIKKPRRSNDDEYTDYEEVK